MSTYALTKIRTFLGREGYGLNAVITRDGKPVAFVMDDASGGEVEVDFTNPLQNARSYEASKGTSKIEEREAHAFALDWLTTSPQAEHARQQEKELAAMYPESHRAPSGADALNSWINFMVDEHESKKRLDRAAKKTTLFRVKGDAPDQWRTLKNAPYSPAVQQFLDNKFGSSLQRVYNRDGL